MSEPQTLAADDGRIVRCRTCSEPLAVKWIGGGMRILAPGPYIDRDGRLTVHCPKCHERIRLMKAA